MKHPRRGDLVGTDRSPTPTHFVAWVTGGDHHGEGSVWLSRRGSHVKVDLSLDEFFATHEWHENHGIPGAWLPKSGV